MPLNGLPRPWGFYATEGHGLSPAQVRLSRELMSDMSASASSSQIRPSNESSSQQDTSSTATEILAVQEVMTLEMLQRTAAFLSRNSRFIGAHPYSPPLSELIEPSKEEKMNELMLALEAMVRRIVKEEMDLKDSATSFTACDFRALLKDYADSNKPEFAAIVSQGALDQPWFDDAIKAEVAEAVPAATVAGAGYTFADRASFDIAVANSVRGSGSLSDWVQDKVSEGVCSATFTVSVS